MVDNLLSNKEAYGSLAATQLSTTLLGSDTGDLEFPHSIVSVANYYGGGTLISYWDGVNTSPVFNNNSPIVSEQSAFCTAPGSTQNLLFSLKHGESSSSGILRVYSLEKEELISATFNPSVRKLLTYAYPSPAPSNTTGTNPPCGFAPHPLPHIGSDVYFVFGSYQCMIIDVANRTLGRIRGSATNPYSEYRLTGAGPYVLLKCNDGTVELHEISLGGDSTKKCSTPLPAEVTFMNMVPTQDSFMTYYGLYDTTVFAVTGSAVTTRSGIRLTTATKTPAAFTDSFTTHTFNQNLQISKEYKITYDGSVTNQLITPTANPTTITKTNVFGPLGSIVDDGTYITYHGVYPERGFYGSGSFNNACSFWNGNYPQVIESRCPLYLDCAVTYTTVTTHTQYYHPYNKLESKYPLGMGGGTYPRHMMMYAVTQPRYYRDNADHDDFYEFASSAGYFYKWTNRKSDNAWRFCADATACNAWPTAGAWYGWYWRDEMGTGSYPTPYIDFDLFPDEASEVVTKYNGLEAGSGAAYPGYYEQVPINTSINGTAAVVHNPDASVISLFTGGVLNCRNQLGSFGSNRIRGVYPIV